MNADGKPVVLLFEDIHPDAVALLQGQAEVRLAKSLEPQALLAAVAEVDAIIMRANGRVTRQLMAAAPALKVVGRHGTGVETIDLAAAAELGVKVVNTPLANVESVAEHAMGMMIALAKRFQEADAAARQGDWDARYRLTGHELRGKTLGLVGLGRIGSRFAEIAHGGLEMDILYYDVQRYPSAERQLRAKNVELSQLLQRANVVSIHVPLLPSTQGLISTDELKLMRDDAILLNTSRGPVVDQGALITALQEGWIGAAGLDVFEPEPLPADSPLLKLENVLLSPHMAAHTEEGLRRMAMVAEDILAVLNGQPPIFEVNTSFAPKKS